MGIYLNPDNIDFQIAVNSKIYVDKSELIKYTNELIYTEQRFICVSRPRRFGKSMAANMLAAYYSRGCDSKEMFSKYKIASDADFEKHLNKYNVIHINMLDFIKRRSSVAESLDYLSKRLIHELKKENGDVDCFDWDDLMSVLADIFNEKKVPFIFVIDEWDCVFREYKNDTTGQAEYLDFLRLILKDQNYVALAYMTGILPIKKYGKHSALNMFTEIAMTNTREYAEFTGFTVDEVKSLCDRYGADFNECKQWYDGYVINGIEIYNPQSVVESMLRGRFRNYWNMTSSYEVISDRISQNFDGTKDAVVRMLSGESVDVNVTTFLNTMQSFRSINDVFTYLIHLGYLAYDEDNETCRVPNREVMQEWQNAVSIDSDYSVTNRIISQSKLLLKETFEGNAEAVALALDESHINVASNRSYNSEDVLQSAIYLAYIYALNKYTIVREMTAGKGFADVVYIPVKNDVPAMIVELKRNSCVDSALNQIRERKYFMSLEHYHGDLLFVAINYDEKTKRHECVIDKFEK